MIGRKSPVDRSAANGAGSVQAGGPHVACVDAWLERAGAGLSPDALLRLFEAAIGALWLRTTVTLGEVTLTAIAERVLHNASETFPLFASLQVEPAGGIPIHTLRERIGSSRDKELIAGVRFVLVELLTVLGNLTAEILTPELHAELSNVALPEANHVAASETRASNHPAGPERATPGKDPTS
jgi:hypothetical protein